MNRSKCKFYVVNRAAKYFVISVYFEYCFLGFPIRASQLRFIMKTLKDVTTFTPVGQKQLNSVDNCDTYGDLLLQLRVNLI
jgi:hypothetical protein